MENEASNFRPNQIANLIPALMERGKIKIGEKGEMIRSKQGNQFQPPQKLDHFRIVGMMRGPDDNFIRDEEIHQLYGDAPTELPVRLLYDDMLLNFVCRYSCFQGMVAWCTGDGIRAKRVAGQGKYQMVECPCERQNPEYHGREKCKINGALSVIIDGAESVGGVWKFRTTSYNSVVGILSSLTLIKSVTGGPLAGVPLMLRVTPKTVIAPGTNRVQTVYVVGLEYRGTFEKLREIGYTMALDRQKHQIRMEDIEKDARRLIAYDSDMMDEDVVPEFYPEQVSTETIDPEKEKTANDIAVANGATEKPNYDLKPKPGTVEPEKKEPVDVVPVGAPTARGTGYKTNASQGASAVTTSPEPETHTDAQAEAETPDNGNSAACQVAFGYQVGGNYAFYSAKLKKTITVKITDINATDQAAPIFRVERTVNGEGQGEFVDITLAALQTKPPLDANGLSTDPAVEAERQAAEKSLAEKNGAVGYQPADLNKLKQKGMLLLISDEQRMAVTSAPVLNQIWAKFDKFKYQTDHPGFAAWLELKRLADNAGTTAFVFSGQPTDPIGTDPERKAIKRIMSQISEKGYDDAGVKLAMRLFSVHDKTDGKIKPFDIESRNMIQLQHVHHFETLLEDIAPCHALRNHIIETEKVAKLAPGTLMGKAIEFIRAFSPAITGQMTHLYETMYQEPVRERIVVHLDEWCNEGKPPAPEQQQLSDLPVISNFGGAVNFAASTVGVEVDDLFGAIVREFFMEKFQAGPIQIANGLPHGTPQKIQSEFAEFYKGKVA